MSRLHAFIHSRNAMSTWGAVAMSFLVGVVSAGSALAQDAVSFPAQSADSGITIAQTTDPITVVRQPPPDVYIVQPGDTLWDISNKFLGNPYYWPRLWSINEHITNPHWIYPGNRIIFVPGTEIEPPALSLGGDDVREGYLPGSVAFQEGEWTCGPDVHYNTTRTRSLLRAPAFLEDDKKLKVVGSLMHAQSGMENLSKWQMVYLKLDDPRSCGCGDVLSIVRKESRRIRHPEGGARYGAMYRVIGEARILHVQDDVATAYIRTSFFEAVRGDLITARIPVDVELEIQPPRGSLDGTIIGRLGQDEYMLVNSMATVFLDRGRSDGVRVGNTFYIVARRDDFVDSDEDDDDLPASVVGRVIVVRVDERSSTAVVLESSREFDTGAHVTMHME